MSAWLSREAADARVLAHSGPEALADLRRTREVLQRRQKYHARPKGRVYHFTPEQIAMAQRSLERQAA